MRIPRRSRLIRLETIPKKTHASFHLNQWSGGSFDFYWHNHPEIEIALILRGHGIRMVGDSIENFSEGDLCLLGSNLPHSWVSEPTPGKSARSIVIQFPPDFLGTHFYGLPETRHFRSLMNAARRGLKVGGAARDEVEKVMHGMLRNPAGSWQNLSDLLWILNRLTSSDALMPLATTGLEPLRNKSANDRIQRILDCIHESPGEIPPQGQLSVKFHFSPQAFSRFFRRCMGKTYQEYVAELRVNRTCHALMESDKGIAEIAYEAGFENLSSFNRLFRQIKGMQPRHYRKLTQQT